MATALSPSSAKKKYAKAKTKVKNAYTSAKKAVSKANTKVTYYTKEVKGAKTTAAKKKAQSMLTKYEKTLKAKKSTESKAKSAYETASRNLSRYKKSPEVSAYHMKNILKKMKKDRDWDGAGGRAYIVPLRPWTDSSYALIYITDMQPTHESTITTTPVERGFSVSTAGQLTSPTYSVTGYLGGKVGDKMKDLQKVSDRLAMYNDDTTSIKFVGDETISEGVITNYTPDYNRQIDGGGGTNAISISMTITKVTYADSNTKKKSTKHNKTTDSGKKNKTSGTKKSGKRYVVTKKNDTYWGIATAHKVSVASVEKLNKYPAKSLPVGVKVYY